MYNPCTKSWNITGTARDWVVGPYNLTSVNVTATGEAVGDSSKYVIDCIHK